MNAGDFAGATALLLGTGTHQPGSDLPDIPAVAGTLADLREALLTRSGLADVRVELDLQTPMELGGAISSAVSAATGPLIVYYVGHGLVSRRGALYLAAGATHSGPLQLEHTGLPYDTMRRYLLDNLDHPVAVVLDCCFSGRAIEGMSGPWDDVAGLAEITGAYVLTSAGRSEPSFAPEGMGHTAFSGALLRLLREGDPRCPPYLTLHDVHRHLSRTLPAGGFPRPRARSTGRVGELVLAANRAHIATNQGVRLSPSELPGGSPYKGLAVFAESDAALYFGRDRLVATLATHLAERHADPAPLIVTGASGSGKSSLLRAGLVPAIRQGALRIPGSSGWSVAVITPRDPIPADADVLVVDQLEEAFLGAESFIDEVCAHEGLVVLGVRADFLGRCAEHPALRPAFQRSQVVVGPMSAAELREAVERPALLSGLELEPGLVELLLRDLGEGAGRLPLLSHALLATWQQRGDAVLTVAGYRHTGGIHGALAATADDVLASLDSPETARALFLRLVHVGEGTDDTRRRVDLGRLLAELPDGPAAREVIYAFAADSARLITLDGDTVAITHEALLAAWPVLRSWLDADRAGLLVEQELVEAAHAWEASGRDASSLYRGTRLELARGRATVPLTIEFIEASRLLEHREAAAARLRRRLRAALSVLFVLVLGATAIAVQANQDADRQRRVADARSLMFEADTLRDFDPFAAVRRGMEAARVSPGVETESALAAQVLTTFYRGRLPGHRRTVNSVAVSPDGRTALTGGFEGEVYLWDLAGPSRRAVLSSGRGEEVTSVRFAPDGRTAVLVWKREPPEVWDLLQQRRIAQLGSSDRIVYAAALHGDRLALAGEDGTEVWDFARRKRLSGPFGPASFAVEMSGDLLLTAGEGGSALLYDLAGKLRPVRIEVGGEPEDATPAIALSADGNFAIVDDRVVNVVGYPRQTEVARLTGHEGRINQVAAIQNGFVTAGADGVVIVWDLTVQDAPLVRARLEAHADQVVALAAGQDGDIVTGGVDGTAVAWRFTDPPRTAVAGVPGRPGQIVTAGSRMLTRDSDDQRATLWEVDQAAEARLVSRYAEQGWGLALSADGQVALVGTHDGALLGQTRIAAGTDVRSVALSADGRTALVGGKGGAVLYAQGMQVRLSRADTTAVALSEDGKLALTASGSTVTPWSVAGPAAGTAMVGHGGTVLSLAIKGDLALSGGEDRKALLWAVTGPAELRPVSALTGHNQAVTAVRFSADGRFALTAGWDETAAVWLLEDRNHPWRVAALARVTEAADFGPGNASVVAGSVPKGMAIWSLPHLAAVADAPLPAACGLVREVSQRWC